MNSKTKECLGLTIVETDKGYTISGPNLNEVFLGKKTYCSSLPEVRKPSVYVTYDYTPHQDLIEGY